MFGRATITLGIGPHSSFVYISICWFRLAADKAIYDQSAEDVDELSTGRSVGRSADPSTLCLHYRLVLTDLFHVTLYLLLRQREPASDADSTCPAHETLLGSLAVPWYVCDLIQPLSFPWPAGIPFVCIIHLKDDMQ